MGAGAVIQLGRTERGHRGGNECLPDPGHGDRSERIPRMVMDSRIRALAFSPDGHLLASGDGDLQGAVRLWNTATGQSVGPPMLHTQPINRIRFSPDGRKLLVAGGDIRKINGEARLWDVATGQPLGPELEITGAVPPPHSVRTVNPSRRVRFSSSSGTPQPAERSGRHTRRHPRNN